MHSTNNDGWYASYSERILGAKTPQPPNNRLHQIKSPQHAHPPPGRPAHLHRTNHPRAKSRTIRDDPTFPEILQWLTGTSPFRSIRLMRQLSSCKRIGNGSLPPSRRSSVLFGNL